MTGSLHRLLTQPGQAPHARGRAFERLCRWYLQSDPVYHARLKTVWLWNEWPGRWGADAGIDLVAEAHDGTLWAIQAKAYDPTRTITKRDVDTFLSESARPEFSYRLLIATTNRIGKTALRTLEAQEKHAGLRLLADLERAEVEWPTVLDDLRVPRPPRKQPRPHQQEALDAVVDGFQKHDRGQLIMACGTGKTLVALWVTERLEAERTLVLLPSLSLLDQTLRELTGNASRPFGFLAVCSDETVVGEDHLISHTADLGLPVTTDPADIRRFLEQAGPSVIFATYQSSPRIAEAMRQTGVSLDLVVADEAHRVAGPASGDFATVLDAARIRSHRRLFMTATPRYFTGRVRRQAGEADLELASMDDPERFGPVFHRLTFAQAIERDLLSDYRVVIVGVDDPTYRAYAEHGRLVARAGKKVEDARTLAAQIALAKTARDYDLRRIISFHGRVKKSREFAAAFPDVVAWMPEGERLPGVIHTDYVSGEMPSGQRDVKLDRLRNLEPGERCLLANARCLGEGVDVPALDGVAFVDPRRSSIDIAQAVGRAIRKTPDKAVGTIILPVFIDQATDAELALDSSVFKPVWDVLRALRAHDETLVEALDSLRRQLGRVRGGSPPLPTRIVLDLPVRVGEDFARALTARLVEQTTTEWHFWYGLLLAFVDRTGHSLVPTSHLEREFKLGAWVRNQRWRRDQLEPNQAALLTSLPGWTWNARGEAWEEGFRYLVEHAQREGHARVSQSHLEGHFALGRWVLRQRRRMSEGRLDADRTGRLEALPGWTWNAVNEAWDEGFRHLLTFVEREGHARVPGDYAVGGFKLGNWVSTQRAFYGRGKLELERIARLESVRGWAWNTLADTWEEGFREMLGFVEREGHARVPQSYQGDRVRLGSWVSTQRMLNKQDKLTAERVARLESLPGWVWDIREEAWKVGFRHLLEYLEQNGHAVVENDYSISGFKLGNWVRTQRMTYARGNLEPERVARLESVDGWTWDVMPKWESGFAHLLAYVARTGHARVPTKHAEGDFRLGQWVVTQRALRRRGELEANRVALLEGVEGWSWDPHADAWEDGFRHLLAFSGREGHGRVPDKHKEEGFNLGTWAGRQRTSYRKGQLSPERAARLEGVAGWTW